MKRADIVIVSAGKPRPHLVIQRDEFDDTSRVTLLPLTSELHDGAPALRIDVAPDGLNGLEQRSQIMIDRCVSVDRTRVHKVVGRLDGGTLRAVEQALLVFLGIV